MKLICKFLTSDIEILNPTIAVKHIVSVNFDIDGMIHLIGNNVIVFSMDNGKEEIWNFKDKDSFTDAANYINKQLQTYIANKKPTP